MILSVRNMDFCTTDENSELYAMFSYQGWIDFMKMTGLIYLEAMQEFICNIHNINYAWFMTRVFRRDIYIFVRDLD